MHQTSTPRLPAFAAGAFAAAILGIGLPLPARAATFPPLNEPATQESHPGKFVWAELFTSDSAAAAKFYTGVVGWTASTVKQHGVAYTVFRNGVHPVAGLRQRESSAGPHASRWIGYIAVSDLAATLTAATQAGATVRAPAREFPRLGRQAIITDPDGAPVGLIQSSSGDSADTEPAVGDWNWFHLLVKDPRSAADFYRRVFAYEVVPDDRPGKAQELLLASGPFNRGGISVFPESWDARAGWLGVIRVANLDAALAQVPQLGGEVVIPPHEAAFGSRSAVVTDPTGGAVGLVEYVNNANPANRP
jgi:predicted enzyme related to lactoylglutathione lyase